MKKILVVGDIIVDVYTYGTVDRLAPDFMGFVFDKLYSRRSIGGAGYVALNIRQMLSEEEASVDLMGSIGPHEHHLIASSGVNVLRTGYESMIKERLVASGEGMPSKPWGKQKILRIDSCKKFKQGLDKMPAGYDIVVIVDYNKGTIPTTYIHKPQSETVFVDSKRRTLGQYWWADYLKVNRQEFDLAGPEESQAAKNLIVTHGRNPVHVYKEKKLQYRVPIFEPELVESTAQFDPCGAGDVFLAGMVTAFVRGKGLADMIRIANIAAGLKVYSFGTEPVSREVFDKTCEKQLTGYLTCEVLKHD